MKWRTILLVVVGLTATVWLVRYLLTPPPGTRMPDQGRQHVSAEIVATTEYNSNPPTSGPHEEVWVRPGIYIEPQPEGKLIHSLEHGYIILHYNCNAGEQSTDATPSATNASGTCTGMIAELEAVARKKGLTKLIMLPRPQLDAPIAVTAWNYVDKMESVDATRIERFIDFYRDHGPEQTME